MINSPRVFLQVIAFAGCKKEDPGHANEKDYTIDEEPGMGTPAFNVTLTAVTEQTRPSGALSPAIISILCLQAKP